MTLPMPLWDGTQDGLQYILDLIAQSVTDTGGRSIGLRYGSVNVTFTAANFSNIATVAHGLGGTPVGVYATADSISANAVFAQVGALSATTFGLQGVSPLALATQTTTIYWLALG